MGTTLRLFLLLHLALPLFAQDLVPYHWFEDVPATDSSVQRSLAFQTVPGVVYSVETTHDLITWTQTTEVYGLGHKHYFPLVELEAPPASPNPPNPPSNPNPSTLKRLVSIRMNPSSSLEGGTILSWVSLEQGVPYTYWIAGNLHPDWQSVPLFAQTYDGFIFLHKPSGKRHRSSSREPSPRSI